MLSKSLWHTGKCSPKTGQGNCISLGPRYEENRIDWKPFSPLACSISVDASQKKCEEGCDEGPSNGAEVFQRVVHREDDYRSARCHTAVTVECEPVRVQPDTRTTANCGSPRRASSGERTRAGSSRSGAPSPHVFASETPTYAALVANAPGRECAECPKRRFPRTGSRVGTRDRHKVLVDERRIRKPEGCHSRAGFFAKHRSGVAREGFNAFVQGSASVCVDAETDRAWARCRGLSSIPEESREFFTSEQDEGEAIFRPITLIKPVPCLALRR